MSGVRIGGGYQQVAVGVHQMGVGPISPCVHAISQCLQIVNDHWELPAEMMKPEMIAMARKIATTPRMVDKVLRVMFLPNR